MRYERDAITMLVYARNSIVTWHRLKFLRLINFCTFHIFLLHNKVWIAKIELFLRFEYQCVRKENNSLSTPPPLSLSLHLINYYVKYNGLLFSQGFIFYGFEFIVECKRHEKIEIERADFFSKKHEISRQRRSTSYTV